MSSFVTNEFFKEVLIGNVDLTDSNIKVALMNTNYTPNITDSTVTLGSPNEAEDTDASTTYVSGGSALDTPTIEIDVANNWATFKALNLEWLTTTFASGKAPAYAVLYDSTASNRLLAVIDLGGEQITVSESFKLNFSVNGVFRLRMY